MNKNIKTIAFDADDTMWENEIYYRATEQKYCQLLSSFLSEEEVSLELLKIEIQNMDLYGYGAKAFILSLIENALKISNNKIDTKTIENIIQLGKELISKPIKLLPEVEEVLTVLNRRYKLVLATKGDLLDQERKLKNSGLIKFFHHVEIMSDKREIDYENLIKKLNLKPEEFLMIGNSAKSDCLPLLNIGSNAILIPYHTTWAHEIIENPIVHQNFKQIEKLSEVLGIV